MLNIAPIRVDYMQRKTWWQRVQAWRRVRNAVSCEPMNPDEEGWSEWIHPLPGYLAQCCGCGLVHEMEFQIVPHGDERSALSPGEGKRRGVIIFRAKRA